MCKRGFVLMILLAWTLILGAESIQAATFKTKNFTVITSDPRAAEQLANRAEFLRGKLAVFWLGKELPNWSKPCKIHIKLGDDLLPGGSTSFTFNKGEVYGWDMEVQGSRDRLYDSVLPHEITHMILASHFRVPLPRWADEGAATFTEHQSERNKYQQQLYKALKTRHGIPLDRLFVMEEYPQDPMPLYAHGFSIVEFLIRQRGPHYFVSFVEACLEKEKDWNTLVYEFYGYSTLEKLQNDWVSWVENGTPEFVGTNMLAGNGTNAPKLTVQSSNLMENSTFNESVQVVSQPKIQPSSTPVDWSTTHVNSANDR